MARGKSAAQIESQLNRALPANADAAMGSVLYDLLKAHNALTATVAALATKLNADAGVTDTNYAGPAASTTVKMPEAR